MATLEDYGSVHGHHHAERPLKAAYPALVWLTYAFGFTNLSLIVLMRLRWGWATSAPSRFPKDDEGLFAPFDRFVGATIPAMLPLLGLVLLPWLECTTIDLDGGCGPAEIASSPLGASMALGFIGYGLWVAFVIDRVWLTPSKRIFRIIRGQDRMLLGASLAFTAAAFLVMVFNLPG